MCCRRCQASGVGSARPRLVPVLLLVAALARTPVQASLAALLLRPALPLAQAAGGMGGRARRARGPEAAGALAGEERSHASRERSLLGVRASGYSNPGVSCISASSGSPASASPLTNMLAPLPTAGPAGLAAAGPPAIAAPSKLGLLKAWKPWGAAAVPGPSAPQAGVHPSELPPACSSGSSGGAAGVSNIARRSGCGLAPASTGGRGIRLQPEVLGVGCRRSGCRCCWVGAVVGVATRGLAGMRLAEAGCCAALPVPPWLLLSSTKPSTFLLFFLSDSGGPCAAVSLLLTSELWA